MTEVTAAIIHKNDKILICQRPKGKLCEFMWEFPGGKLEKGESYEECIKRECREELNINIDVVDKMTDIIYEYPKLKVHIHFFNCVIAEGEIIKKEHNDIKWIGREDVSKFEFCPADSKVVDMVKFGNLGEG